MKFWNVSMNDLGVVLARFVNPPMNYFCAGAAAELSELVAQWSNGDVRVVVLTGGPEQFITHYSVEELAAFSSDRDEMQRVGTALSVATMISCAHSAICLSPLSPRSAVIAWGAGLSWRYGAIYALRN